MGGAGAEGGGGVGGGVGAMVRERQGGWCCTAHALRPHRGNY